MPNRKKSYGDVKICRTVAVRRSVLKRFDKKVKEQGFNRSEVVEELMLIYLKKWGR